MNNELYHETKAVMEEFGRKSNLKTGDILVVGCSTSEILGEKIGTYSSPDAANAVFEGIYEVLRDKGIYIAAQCCEHLNRAIILEAEAVPFLDTVKAAVAALNVIISVTFSSSKLTKSSNVLTVLAT